MLRDEKPLSLEKTLEETMTVAPGRSSERSHQQDIDVLIGLMIVDGKIMVNPLVMTKSLLLNMTIDSGFSHQM